MKHTVKAFQGALLAIGVAAILLPDLAVAGQRYVWDSVCNCRRPDHEYNTRKVVRAPARVVTRERVVNHTRVVRGKTRLEQENRLVVHVRPVINREVVVHRTNTVVKDVILHKVNTTNRVQEVHRREVINRHIPGTVTRVVERRQVRGVDCNCGPTGYRGGEVVSYRY